MRPDATKRLELEEAIIIASRKIGVVTHADNAAWVSGQAVDDFLDAWYELAKYFQTYQDTVIGIRVVQRYVDFTEHLRAVIQKKSFSAERRHEADEFLDALESNMEEIIKHAGLNWGNRDLLEKDGEA